MVSLPERNVSPFPWHQLKSVGRQVKSVDGLGNVCEQVTQNGLSESVSVALADLGPTVQANLKARVLGAVDVSIEGLPQVLGFRLVAVLLSDPLGARAVLEIDVNLALRLIHGALGIAASNTFAGRLSPPECGALAYLCTKAGTHVQTRGWRIENVVSDPRTAVEWLGSSVRLGAACFEIDVVPTVAGQPSVRGLTRVWAEASVWRKAWTAPQTDHPWFARLPKGLSIPLRAQLATLEASLGELASLDVGDVILLDEGNARQTDHGIVCDGVCGNGSFSFACRVSADGLAVLALDTGINVPRPKGPRRYQINPRTLNVMPEQTSDALPQTLTSTQIRLTLDLGDLELTLGEIASLNVGDVLSTHRLIGSSVFLRTASSTVATGELVNVNGEVGFRITALGAGASE